MNTVDIKIFLFTGLENIRARVKRNMEYAVNGVKGMKSALTFTHLWTFFVLSLYAGLAVAQSVTDGHAPWDSSLCGVASWFKGPTMLAVGTIAFGAAGAGFVFGEELTGILKKVVNITMGICLAVGGAAFLGWIANKMGASAAQCTL